MLWSGLLLDPLKTRLKTDSFIVKFTEGKVKVIPISYDRTFIVHLVLFTLLKVGNFDISLVILYLCCFLGQFVLVLFPWPICTCVVSLANLYLCCFHGQLVLVLFQVLEQTDFNKRQKSSSIKSISLNTILKFSKPQLQEKAFKVKQTSVCSSVFQSVCIVCLPASVCLNPKTRGIQPQLGKHIKIGHCLTVL